MGRPACARMTYFWVGIGAMLLLGLGLIVWASQSGPDRAGHDLNRRRTNQTRVGAVLVGVSLCALVIAYFTADWP
ncbi:hypothetical protein GCM10009858_25390 [Terrabacter carboxydivorans]|uniref:Uncharacterized protein n=2 Tax=Terrabacter carboxydivorans TaxID=619730 RepID=A0ABP5YW36_9MICO